MGTSPHRRIRRQACRARRHPKAAVVVTVEEALFHCGKAVNRARLCGSARAPLDRNSLPTVGTVLVALAELNDVSASVLLMRSTRTRGQTRFVLTRSNTRRPRFGSSQETSSRNLGLRWADRRRFGNTATRCGSSRSIGTTAARGGASTAGAILPVTPRRHGSRRSIRSDGRGDCPFRPSSTSSPANAGLSIVRHHRRQAANHGRDSRFEANLFGTLWVIPGGASPPAEGCNAEDIPGDLGLAKVHRLPALRVCNAQPANGLSKGLARSMLASSSRGLRHRGDARRARRRLRHGLARSLGHRRFEAGARSARLQPEDQGPRRCPSAGQSGATTCGRCWLRLGEEPPLASFSERLACLPRSRPIRQRMSTWESWAAVSEELQGWPADRR